MDRDYKVRIPYRFFNGSSCSELPYLYAYVQAFTRFNITKHSVFDAQTLAAQTHIPLSRVEECILDLEPIDCDGEIYHFDEVQYKEMDERFIVVTTKEIIKIKPEMFKTWLAIISTFDYRVAYKDKKAFYGYMKMDYIASLAGISHSTITRHIAEFEKNELLYVHRNKPMQANSYCRYEDANLMLEYIQNETGAILYKQHTSFTNRSMGAKYAKLRNGHKYSPAEIQEIYEYALEFNEQQRKYKEKNPGYTPSYKDLSIFPTCNN